MTIQEATIPVNGLSIHTYLAGDHGSPVVLLHGGGVDSAALSWKGVIPHLAENHRVYAPEYPGFGGSQYPDRPVTQEFLIEASLAFLDALQIERASLVGISLGGAVAIGLALQAAQRVDKLVLVDSYGLQRTAPFQKLSYVYMQIPLVNGLIWASMRSPKLAKTALKAIIHDPQAITAELVDEMAIELKRPKLGRAWTSYQKSEILWGGTRTCYLNRLNEICASTLLIHGTADQLVPLACAREAQSRISGSRLATLEGCGHWPQRENPAGFTRLLTEFLDH